jgi:hypothetical protein
VIVPFREQPEQNRGLQLARFAEELPRFLRSAAVAPPLAAFHVIVGRLSAVAEAAQTSTARSQFHAAAAARPGQAVT